MVLYNVLKYILILPLILLATPAGAFNHEGFEIGVGAGASLISKWHSANGGINISSGGVASMLLLGYSMDRENKLMVEWNISEYESNLFGDSTYTYTSFIIGFAWYHYLSSGLRSLYTVIGIGSYDIWECGGQSPENGWGFLVGGGYHFAKWLQAGVYIKVGRTGAFRGRNIKSDHLDVSLMLAWLSF
jgi:hypothetical protein